MEQRLTLVTLGVADLHRARNFYEIGLGWTPVMVVENEVAFFQMNGIAFGLFGRDDLNKDGNFTDSGATYSGITLAYNARSEAEVDAVFDLAARAGATIQKAPHKTDWGGYSGYFLDLDGHPWEVAHNPFWTLDSQGNLTIPKNPA